MGSQGETLLRVDADARRSLEDEVRRAVNEKPGLTSTELARSFPKARKSAALDAARELAGRGSLHRWVKGKTERFFVDDPIEALDRLVPRLLEAGPLTEAELSKAVERSGSGHPSALFKEWLKSAKNRRLVHPAAAAPRSRSKRFGREPDARLALATVLTALKKVLPALEEAGVDRAAAASVLLEELGIETETLSGHAAPSRAREDFLDALQRLSREHPAGTLLSVRDLRSRLSLDKKRFDELALELARERVVGLHHHDHPHSLPEHERRELVEDERHTHYVGITLRGRS
jgi:hypothetical protein